MIVRSLSSLSKMPVVRLNVEKYVSRCHCSTNKKFEKISKENKTLKVFVNIFQEQKGDIPTIKQIRNDPKLQNDLKQMYKGYANDPEFNETTKYVMKKALENLD